MGVNNMDNQSSFYQQIDSIHFPAPLPKTLLAVEQHFDAPSVGNVAEATVNALTESGLLDKMEAGGSVAVGVGSRGIANLSTIVKTTVDTLKSRDLHPFVIPAMGSHAGATAEGQTEMLANLGVTSASVGAEIRATMDVTQIGDVSEIVAGGPPLYQDVYSVDASHTLLINRIKAHTSFRGSIESGLAKMCAIGLGKQFGAADFHRQGVKALKTYLAPAARIYERNTNVVGGLAIVENAYDDTAEIVGLSAAEIGAEREAALLVRAKSLMASLPFSAIDVLVVRELGKNISGTGMDTNVIGRCKIPRQPENFGGPDIGTIAVLDLTAQSHGNANGMGLANVTTARLTRKIDWQAIYTNSLTSGVLGMWRASMPLAMADDARAIQAALLGCAEPPEEAKIVLIRNTLALDTMWVSASLRAEVDAHPRLSVLDEVALSFDDGIMVSPWEMER